MKEPEQLPLNIAVPKPERLPAKELSRASKQILEQYVGADKPPEKLKLKRSRQA